jgi:hypothetical protein
VGFELSSALIDLIIFKTSFAANRPIGSVLDKSLSLFRTMLRIGFFTGVDVYTVPFLRGVQTLNLEHMADAFRKEGLIPGPN